MSELVGEGVIHIRTDDAGVDVAGAGSKAGKGYTKGFLGGMRGLVVGIGGVLAAREVLGFAKEALAEGREAQKVGAATEQIIKSTGGTANVTAGQVSELASALSVKVGVDDEAIQSGANLLLTFKNVRNEAGKGNDVFDRTVASTQDLAAAGFGSIESASKGLGKALNDPLKGITALGRAGVTFTEAQKEQIKALVESGDLLSAQKIILGEVESQVGGVAEATATSSEKAQVAWGNLKEQIGTALIPTVDALADTFATSVVPAISDFVDSIGPAAATVSGFVSDVTKAFGLLGEDDGASGFGEVMDHALGNTGKYVQPLTDLATTALDLFDTLRSGGGEALPYLRDLLDDVLDVGQEIADDLLPVMADTFRNVVLPAILDVGGYLLDNLVPIIAEVADIAVNDLLPVFIEVATFLYGTLYPALIGIAVAVAENLKPVLDELFQVVREDILPTFKDLVATVRNELLPALQPIIENIVAVIGVALRLAAAILGKVLPPLLNFAGFLIRNLVPIIAAVIVKVVQFVGLIFRFGQALVDGAQKVIDFAQAWVDMQRRIVDAITGLPGAIKDLVGDMVEAGGDLIGGLFDGIKDMASGAGGLVANIASDVVGAVKSQINDLIDVLNDGIPDSLGSGPFSVDLPNNPIPHLARGTNNWPGGWSWVGEQGPELVNVPKGARVVPAGQSAAMAGAAAGGGGVVIMANVQPHNYSEFEREMLDKARLSTLGTRRAETTAYGRQLAGVIR